MICPLIIRSVDMLGFWRIGERDNAAQAIFGSTDYVYVPEAEPRCEETPLYTGLRVLTPLEGLPQHDESRKHEYTPGHAPHQITAGRDFLHQHERRDSSDPQQIHHPRYKQ